MPLSFNITSFMFCIYLFHSFPIIRKHPLKFRLKLCHIINILNSIKYSLNFLLFFRNHTLCHLHFSFDKIN